MARKKVKCEDIDKLKNAIELIGENRKPIAENIFQKIKFMNETLIKLEKQIQDEGAVIKAVNGNGFETISEHPAQKSYNTMIGRYNGLIKTLIDMIPENEPAEDEFMKFINGRGGGGKA